MTDADRDADPTRDASVIDSGVPVATLEPWVIALLACPVDRGAVRSDEGELVCNLCGRRYPVLSGIPRMVPDLAPCEQKF
jgi:uncharacterized protein YbaR (Trm112 family)